jgi:hypothetical protein
MSLRREYIRTPDPNPSTQDCLIRLVYFHVLRTLQQYMPLSTSWLATGARRSASTLGP